jgi:2-keto-4-pentenoate hydratase/2-oxohepta-3-ene-1,7-dioic acid hydratase in catechol pathway
MQFVRYTHGGGQPAWGAAAGEGLVPLAETPAGEPSYDDLANPSYVDRVARSVERTDAAVSRDHVRPLAPVPEPGKIVCVGLNYRDHAEEQDEPIPEKPLLFGKAPTCVTNPGDPIVHPPGEEVDYEVELGVVIGREATAVDRADAADYIAGYTAVNDVSGRTAQMGDEQFFRGKSYDTFAPMGPSIVPEAAIDPNALDVECRVNGDVKQSSNTEQFVFDVYDLVEYISEDMTLRPGDVISTGTPGGVGIFRDPPDLLEPGDDVVVEIEGIGALGNPVVAE